MNAQAMVYLQVLDLLSLDDRLVRMKLLMLVSIEVEIDESVWMHVLEKMDLTIVLRNLRVRDLLFLDSTIMNDCSCFDPISSLFDQGIDSRWIYFLR